jgi:hypothetical protein
MDTEQEVKGFFASLFDFSFTSFVTTKLIKFLYVLGILLAALGGLFLIITAFSQGVLPGLGALIIAPLFLLLGIMYLRVILEVLIVIFRISENTAEIARRGRTT